MLRLRSKGIVSRDSVSQARTWLIWPAASCLAFLILALSNATGAPAPSAIDQKPVYVADRTSVRVVGAPFVPNTNPSER